MRKAEAVEASGRNDYQFRFDPLQKTETGGSFTAVMRRDQHRAVQFIAVLPGQPGFGVLFNIAGKQKTMPAILDFQYAGIVIFFIKRRFQAVKAG